MKSRRLPASSAWVCAALLAAPAGATPQNNTEQLRSAEVQQIASGLQELVARIGVVQAQARSTLAQAERVVTPAECEALAREVAELSAELERLTAAFKLQVSALRMAADPLKARTLAALKLPTLKDAKTALEQIEAELSKDSAESGEDAKRMLGFVRYELADILRQLAVQEMRSATDHRGAAAILERAVSKYEQVLTSPDAMIAEIGSSLHAAALRRIVQSEVALYEGCRRILEQQPTAGTYLKKVKEHRDAALAAFERLQRVFPDARVEDGRLAVGAAREDVARLRRQ